MKKETLNSFVLVLILILIVKFFLLFLSISSGQMNLAVVVALMEFLKRLPWSRGSFVVSFEQEVR